MLGIGYNFNCCGNLERKIEKGRNVVVLSIYCFGTLSSCLIAMVHLIQLKTSGVKIFVWKDKEKSLRKDCLEECRVIGKAV